MSEEKWVIQKWRTGDRFEGLTIPEALSMLFSLAEEGGYKVFVASPGLHPDSTILPVVNLDPESRGGHFRLMLDAPEPEPEPDKYEVLKTNVPGIGPWYVSPSGETTVLGVFRKEEDARLFAEAKEADSADKKNGFFCGLSRR